MFVHNKDIESEDCEPGVTRKILCYDNDLMMVEVKFESGASIYIPTEASHGVKALEESTLVDVFNPMRDEFV